MLSHIQGYSQRLSSALSLPAMEVVPVLAAGLQRAWRDNRKIFFCGNGGSAGNAIHLANDFLYGAGLDHGGGLQVEALSANAAVLTCLANDMGYDEIYSEQLRVKAQSGDVLIALSGSGNSPNIIKALQAGNLLGMQTFAILAFDGGQCKGLAQTAIHFELDDMQIAEDLQLVIGHMCMQWLCKTGAQMPFDKLES